MMKSPIFKIQFSLLIGFVVFSFFGTTSLSSCTKDKAVSPDIFARCDTVDYSYSNDIEEIIRASCTTGLGPGTGCHDAWILQYPKLKSSVDDGNFAYRVLDLQDMPVPNNSFNIPPLTQEQLDQLECWILTGARED